MTFGHFEQRFTSWSTFLLNIGRFALLLGVFFPLYIGRCALLLGVFFATVYWVICTVTGLFFFVCILGDVHWYWAFFLPLYIRRFCTITGCFSRHGYIGRFALILGVLVNCILAFLPLLWGTFVHCYIGRFPLLWGILFTIILGVGIPLRWVAVKWVAVMPVLFLYLKRCSRLRIVVFTINAIRQIIMVITECQFIP